MTEYTQEELDRAFNAGSDARIQGQGIGTNPHSLRDPLSTSWRSGWCDVRDHYGEENWRLRRPWPIRPLPTLRGRKAGELRVA